MFTYLFFPVCVTSVFPVPSSLICVRVRITIRCAAGAGHGLSSIVCLRLRLDLRCPAVSYYFVER